MLERLFYCSLGNLRCCFVYLCLCVGFNSWHIFIANFITECVAHLFHCYFAVIAYQTNNRNNLKALMLACRANIKFEVHKNAPKTRVLQFHFILFIVFCCNSSVSKSFYKCYQLRVEQVKQVLDLVEFIYTTYVTQILIYGNSNVNMLNFHINYADATTCNGRNQIKDCKINCKILTIFTLRRSSKLI